jgi:hypothetical protein
MTVRIFFMENTKDRSEVRSCHTRFIDVMMAAREFHEALSSYHIVYLPARVTVWKRGIAGISRIRNTKRSPLAYSAVATGTPMETTVAVKRLFHSVDRLSCDTLSSDYREIISWIMRIGKCS